MSGSEEEKASAMSIYEIRVRGHLDQHWSAWFEGLTISHDGEGNTILHGPLADEAALHGVLIKVRDLALPLLAFRRDDVDGSAQERAHTLSRSEMRSIHSSLDESEPATEKEIAMTIESPSVSTLARAVGYAHVTIATGIRLVFCAGQGALDAQGNLVGAHDLTAQTAQAIKNLALALEAAHATLADVVKTTLYVVDLDDDSLSKIFAGISAATEETGQQFPLVAGTLLGVQRLALAGTLIEIEVVAVLP